MASWWMNFGRESLLAGVMAGLLVAAFAFLQRWYAAKKGTPISARNGLLFVLDFIQTTSFFTLALMLSTMAAEKIIPKDLMWFLVTLIAVAMIAAALISAVFTRQYARERRLDGDMSPLGKPTPGPRQP